MQDNEVLILFILAYKIFIIAMGVYAVALGTPNVYTPIEELETINTEGHTVPNIVMTVPRFQLHHSSS